MAIIAKLQSLLASPDHGKAQSAPAEAPVVPEALSAPAELRTTRQRRATDATESSVSTTGSDTGDHTQGLTKHETQRLVQWRLADLERLSRVHPVSKVLQQYEWDCGLACVSMIVRAFGATCTVEQLARDVHTQSVWTIDLAMLLRTRLPRADFTYYTTCIGVNPQHSESMFYSSELDDDWRRVIALFSAARVEQTVRVVELELPLLDLKRFVVHRQYVAILLVDTPVLTCTLCSGHHRRSRSAAPRMLSWLRRTSTTPFVGHYVLVIAYVPALDMFVYRNPALPEEFCLAPAATVDAARRRPGTDHDCIILKL
ncbi:hypothetical protein IW148_000399 [Coemansia sp. RSA 1199]|nr:hypothetical protein IW148_000399 [Coemansia sp. RSA 1199]